MKKFLVQYLSSVSTGQQLAGATPEQMKAGTDAWMAWAKEAQPHLVDLGAPLGNPTTVSAVGVQPGHSQVSGYSIMQAASKEEITNLLKKHPHHRAPGASIEVLEFMPIPGM